MIRFWFAIIGFILLCGPVLGQAVRVTSGEHDGFTRLVFEYGNPVDWTVGRDADGYILHLAGPPPAYDLTAAFNLIGKSRLSALWLVPETGDVRMGLACPCHAIPFEFRPGIIVVDLKDGPPPKGSAFENPIIGAPDAKGLPAQEGKQEPTNPDKPQNSDATPSYVWTEIFQKHLPPENPAPTKPDDNRPEKAAPLMPPDPGLQPLRDTILQQMARGASQGVVEMAPGPTPEIAAPKTGFPSAQIRIGEAPASVTKPTRSIHKDLGAEGTTCIRDASLAIAEWGDETRPLVDQLATMRNELSGEFDKPNPETIEKAIKFYIYIGFGAEAAQMISAFDIQAEDASIWRALAQTVDAKPDSDGIFHGQSACGGAAALWAVLSDESASDGKKIDQAAVRLAFSALPIHLRKSLGPRLIDTFLSLGDEETARALKAAISRAPGDTGGKEKLLEAEIDLHADAAESSEQIAQAVLNDPGPDQAEALITYTKARIAQKLPVAAKIALELQAHLADKTGTPLEKPLNEALILAQAASGAFEAALAGLQSYPEPEAEVWSLAAHLAPDTAFLAMAVLDPTQPRPTVTSETAIEIARRLAGFGLGAEANIWLSGVENPDPLLRAQTALAQGDGRAALQPLVGIEGELSQALRLQALSLLDENNQRAGILLDAGDIAGASAALARAGAWKNLAENGDATWKSVAEKLADTPSPDMGAAGLPYGSLARGHDLATAGASTREAIDGLLKATPAPTAATPSSN